MSAHNTIASYGWVAKLLHWSMALLILGMLALGYYMGTLETSPFKFELYWWHKSVGTLILMLVTVRLAWKATNPRVVAVPMPRWQKMAAKATHAGLYFLMFAMPLSGIIMSNAHGFPVSFFGLFTLPALTDSNHDIAELTEELHELGKYGFFLLISVHVAGALKHHFLDKDATLRRMLP